MQRLIEDVAEQIRRQERFTGVGIAVSHRDGPVRLAVNGVRRNRFSVPILQTDKWHIGSITKSITATMIGKLVDEGVLKFESMIPDLLPGISMHPRWVECSLAHLLTHTSGLPRNFPKRVQKIDPPNSTDLVLARRDWIQQTLMQPPKTPCGSAYLYSNVGYSTIGHIIETQTQSCYEEVVGERFFDPCGLNSAGFGAPIGDGPNDQPMGHFDMWWYRKAINPFKGRADNTPIISAAGRAHMNLKDLAAYGRMHLDGELGTDSFLKAETWQKLHEPVKNADSYGWAISTSRTGGRVIWHNGSNTLWYAVLLLSPERNLVLALTANNSASEKARDAIEEALNRIGQSLV